MDNQNTICYIRKYCAKHGKRPFKRFFLRAVTVRFEVYWFSDWENYL